MSTSLDLDLDKCGKIGNRMRLRRQIRRQGGRVAGFRNEYSLSNSHLCEGIVVARNSGRYRRYGVEERTVDLACWREMGVIVSMGPSRCRNKLRLQKFQNFVCMCGKMSAVARGGKKQEKLGLVASGCS